VKKILAVMTVATALLLAGCSQVGAAATIGDTKITQATVQTSIDSIMAARVGVDTSQMQLETGEALNRGQLRFHVLTTLLKAVGEQLKLTVTKAEIDTRRASIIEQVGGATSLPTALVGAGIAEKDLELRGPGDIDGTRQSGALNFKLANIINDKAETKKQLYYEELMKV
jgi:hypothetical protein